MSNLPDLHPIAANAGRPLVVGRKAAPQAPITSAVWTADKSTSYQLNAKCQDFITRYLGRSLTTPDDPNMMQVNRQLLKLAFAVSIITPSLHPSDGIVAALYIAGLSSVNICPPVPFLNACLPSCGAYI